MFLRVVETIVTQELVSVANEDIDNDTAACESRHSSTDETKLSDVHGELLRRESE